MRLAVGLALVQLLATYVVKADTSDATFDYIVVGSGPGGGTVATRLAEEGYEGNSLPSSS